MNALYNGSLRIKILYFYPEESKAKKKNSCVSGSLPEKNRVGRKALLFFFFFFCLWYKPVLFLLPPLIKYRQCQQAVDPGDMYYDRSFLNSGKSRGPRMLPWGTP